MSVQLSLIALFLKLDLDLLVAGRTAPSHSWANPVERIMSIVNLGIQCIGVMRERASDEFEKAAEKCNSIKEIRSNCAEFTSEVSSSLSPSKDLLNSIMTRLELKGRQFNIFQSAPESEIDSFFNILLKIDSSLSKSNTTKKSIEKCTCLQSFISHCCIFRRYSLTIRKCGGSNCSICSPVQMPSNIISG